MVGEVDYVREVAPEILDFLDSHDMWSEPYRDLLSVAPTATTDFAYRCQFAVMQRRIDRGDVVIGFKAAGTSPAAQQQLGGEAFIMGTLTRSLMLDDGGVFATRPGKTFVEAEVGVVLARPLRGPGVTYYEALSAIGGYCAAMEISPWSPAAMTKLRSRQHLVATQKTTGKMVVGRRVIPASIDLRYEGAVVEIDGEIVATGTGCEVMGDPVNVVVELANKLARFGRCLDAGMLIMTGSVAEPFPADQDLSTVRVTFSRLGSVGAHFVSTDSHSHDEVDQMMRSS
ncbi:2-keto-4-pentenoate hydratase [Mycobacterium colombiense]|uniref:2-keto-4-pentenoate hydratase n=1 Tax=Mycobacterium colombiense TaxID=339268 RepID=UPI00200B8C8F|nr:fumarylacetoacetate hydrolase family protein [Mycobacterium colombiense]MCK8646707.1 fumarylacetoacetate hydrolase family protein [Mycobacterium colombiense]